MTRERKTQPVLCFILHRRLGRMHENISIFFYVLTCIRNGDAPVISLLAWAELVFTSTTYGTDPIGWQICKGSACFYIWFVSGCRIIFIATQITSILFHEDAPYAFHRPCKLQYSRALTFSAVVQNSATGASPGLRNCL